MPRCGTLTLSCHACWCGKGGDVAGRPRCHTDVVAVGPYKSGRHGHLSVPFSSHRCGGINPYTLMGLYGPHHQRWLDPQDEDMRRTTDRRAPQGYKILYQIGYFACNSVPSGYIRRGKGPLEDRSYKFISQHNPIQSDAGRRYYANSAAEPG